MKIRIYPDSILRKQACPVREGDLGEKLDDLAGEMIEIMRGAHGIGLAANQVGRSLRLIVVGPPEEGVEPQALVNPVITSRRGRLFEEEGCLSVPGVTAKVRRHSHVLVEAQNLQGERIEFEAQDLLARALQHEIDHLEGVLFIDRVSAAARIAYGSVIDDLEARARR